MTDSMTPMPGDYRSAVVEYAVCVVCAEDWADNEACVRSLQH
jgi:hypothetical protein